MTGISGSFDASQFQPRQAGEAHPIGMFDFQITNTEIKPTKDQSGGLFEVEFTTPAGKISNRYNLWNNSPKAVEISYGQLSALCHATGIFKLDWQNEGLALRGGRGKLEVGKQKDTEYVEIKRVFDINGNEPGKSGAMAQPQMQQPPQQTMQQPQPQAWAPPGQQQQQQPPMQQQPNGGWAPQQQAQPAPQQQPQQPPPQGWAQQQPTPQSASGNSPPWGAR